MRSHWTRVAFPGCIQKRVRVAPTVLCERAPSQRRARKGARAARPIQRRVEGLFSASGRTVDRRKHRVPCHGVAAPRFKPPVRGGTCSCKRKVYRYGRTRQVEALRRPLRDGRLRGKTRTAARRVERETEQDAAEKNRSPPWHVSCVARAVFLYPSGESHAGFAGRGRTPRGVCQAESSLQTGYIACVLEEQSPDDELV